ncbi:MAG: ABC transporter substrate-binding protein, partial [Chloroflexi bacterium]|nr:ABC transporter substrate-binding protein [Chloroflexota bacterium]
MRTGFLISILMVSVVVAACAPATQPAQPAQPAPSTQPAVSVKWIWTAVSGVSAGAWTAIDAGYFKEEGLEVEPIHIASSSRAVPALIANEAQFSNLDGNLLVQASLQGADVVGLLAVTNRLVFSVMADPSIASGPDLKGKRLGITRTGSTTHTAAIQALALWKLNPDSDVALIQLSEVPSILAGLQAKQVDAGVVSPPTNTQAKAAGFKELLNLATDGPEYAAVTIASTRAYATDHQSEVLAFARGYARGLQRFKTDKAYGMQVLAHYFELDDQAVLGDTWTEFSRYLENVPYITG